MVSLISVAAIEFKPKLTIKFNITRLCLATVPDQARLLCQTMLLRLGVYYLCVVLLQTLSLHTSFINNPPICKTISNFFYFWLSFHLNSLKLHSIQKIQFSYPRKINKIYSFVSRCMLFISLPHYCSKYRHERE